MVSGVRGAWLPVRVNICWPLKPALPPEDQTIVSRPFSCLAIETATELPGLALLRGDRLALREARGLRAPSRAVFEWVRELLLETETSLGQLDCVAFGAGPGSFTGVRVAVALAQGLGFARGLPLCPVSSLATLAAGAFRNSTADTVACCLDARMGEVYLGIYRRDATAGVVALVADALLAPEAVRLPGPGSILAVGNGWTAYPELLTHLEARLVDVLPEQLPSAADLAYLARPRYLAGQIVSPLDALPNYLRDRVASVPASMLTGRSVQ
ncbi:MAG: tRNA (adenosine(37)-N6)-threonylcarbamoyltransferase complex dimerization subunit type 1 TsaB [Gammaproteobacteria bacterium]